MCIRARDYAIREEDIPQILKEYDKLALEYIKRKKDGRGFNFFHFMLDLTAGPCVATVSYTHLDVYKRQI